MTVFIMKCFLMLLPVPSEESQPVESVDAMTQNWPVPSDMCVELSDLKHEFRAVPLHVYLNHKYREPVGVSDAIIGVLVDPRFELRHFFIRKRNYDLYIGNIG